MINDSKFKLMVGHKLTYWDKIEDYKKLLDAMAMGYLGNYSERISQAAKTAIRTSPPGDQRLFFEVAKEDLLILQKPAQAA